MGYHVHIKIADRGWILEKCASEIAKRSDRVSFGSQADPRADIQYYVNYSARSRRVSPIEIGFFTHSEREDAARRRYFAAAHEVDHSVCMSRRYADELAAAGVKNVTTISPGVDLDEFSPKVRIGVVGRTYHTGRKGEAIVAQVLKTPGIEWRFTGSGWPGPSRHIAEGAMADFYNDLDYVLVPALYEGGPMCVLEALACGVPIISSDVGWSFEYPHIAFKNGDAESLRGVLDALVEERAQLRRAVASRTWGAWADAHLELFERLAPRRTAKNAGNAGRREGVADKVVLLTHGDEGTILGGPSVRVPRTAAELNRIGVDATLLRECRDNFSDAPIAHIFNVWPAQSCFDAIVRAKSAGKQVVLSPIFLNLTHTDLFAHKIPELFRRVGAMQHGATFDAAMRSIVHDVEQAHDEDIVEHHPGYHQKVRACIELADHVIYLSEYERECVGRLGAKARAESVVVNPVDSGAFSRADPTAFAEAYGLTDYILCVGRIEPRKNQLLLARAARDLDRQIVFIGHEGDAGYAALVGAAAGEKAVFIPRMEPDDPLLRSAFRGASAFCLPSWAEGAPLAALEAGAAGVPLVLSSLSAEREYFGEFAQYVNPADVTLLREALERAIATKSDADRSARQIAFVSERFDWRAHAEATARAYDEVLYRSEAPSVPWKDGVQIETDGEGPIYFDLTTSVHFVGHPTGIARVEDRAFKAFLETFPDRVVPVAWTAQTKKFMRLSIADAISGISQKEIDALADRAAISSIEEDPIHSRAQMIVLGGAWIRNREIVDALRGVKSQLHLNVTVLVHDLIQMKLAHLYPGDTGAVFADNIKYIAKSVDSFLVYSEATLTDLLQFLRVNQQYFKRVSKFRLGDMTGIGAASARDLSIDKMRLREKFRDRDFVLYVSSIDIRKNHRLLIDVWRRLAQQRGRRTPDLVLVGRPYWRGDEVMLSVAAEHELQAHVHFLTDVDDDELDWFYKNCLFTVYPSLYEGWGLPVVEALSYGKACLVSDRSSTAEIAPHLTDLLDPYDFRAWLDRINFYFDNRAALARVEANVREQFTEYSWPSAVTDIVGATAGLPYSPPHRSSVWGDTLLCFKSPATDASEEVCVYGWGRAEKFGRWMVGRVGRMEFIDRTETSKQLFARVGLHAFVRDDKTPRELIVRVNGEEVGRFSITAARGVIDFPLPRSARFAEFGRRLTIEFETPSIITPKSLGQSADARPLGIGIHALSIAATQEAANAAWAGASHPVIINGSSIQVGQPGGKQSRAEQLAIAAALLEVPARLPDSNWLFRVLRTLGADVWVLWVYGRLMGRTHGSVRRVIDLLRDQ